MPRTTRKRSHAMGDEYEYDDGKKKIDLTGVPKKPPILRNRKGPGKRGISKYVGVSFDKSRNKWKAEIGIDGKSHRIGTYDNEEAAAVDYARAVFKYKEKINLTGVPKQLPILKGDGKSGASKYQGVTIQKSTKKWVAQIMIDGKSHRIGTYDNEEDAAVDYARAVFKYKGGIVELRRQHTAARARTMPNDDTTDAAVYIDCMDGKKKRRKIDLTGVPPKPPILKVGGYKHKYQGVSFHTPLNKWLAHIIIDGKMRHIGYYDTEKEAAVDHARAVFKYAPKKQKRNVKVINLTGVPEQSPILKLGRKGGGGGGASKYVGVYFEKSRNKWKAQIAIDGKSHRIGRYDNEEDAAVAYARAVFKYAPKKQMRIDLTDVPNQLPILKGDGKSGASKYQGVMIEKSTKKWMAQITIDGKRHRIGTYDNEEAAAVDYARAVFKYKGGIAEIKRQQQQKEKRIDLTDVPEQSPILRGSKRGTSKYQGVYFSESKNKWIATIAINGKPQLFIGHYDNEEEAAVDYARAVFKYKGGRAEIERLQKQNVDLSDASERQSSGLCSYGLRSTASRR